MKRLSAWLNALREWDSRVGYSCDCCERELFDYPLRRVCEECETKFLKNTERVCEKCGRSTVADGVCLSCKKEMPAFELGVSPFVYFGEVASVVNRIKNGNRRLAYYFGTRMAEYYLQAVPDIKERFSRGRYEVNGGILYIVPVPTTAEARRKRGYNQAEELAQTVAQKLFEAGLAVGYCPNALEKKESKEQKKLTFSERMKSAEESYRVQDRTIWKDKCVLIVDDIMTTGATGSACARRLYKAKAKQVHFLVGASLPEKR